MEKIKGSVLTVRLISPNEDVKWAVRCMSLELSRRIRTEDMNVGVNMKMIITGTKLRLWIEESPGGSTAELKQRY